MLKAFLQNPRFHMFGSMREKMVERVLFCCVMILFVIGCKPAANPGTWDHTRVEEHLKKKHNLVDISLVQGPEGGFNGSGKTSEGETYTFKVKQDADQKKLSWDFNSDRGDVGNEVLEIVKAE
jgi:hypothetical protein